MTARRWNHTPVLVLIAMLSSWVVLSQPARAIAAPTRVEVHYGASYADVRWSAGSDATSYAVEVSKDGFYGPWRRWTTNSATTTARIPFTWHPYHDSEGVYRYKVIAINSGGAAARSVAFNKSRGYGVSTADSQKAATKANSCLKQGLAAGVTTAASTGIYAVAAAWIPGVNAVSAGAAAALTGGSGAATYVVCLLPW